MNDKCITFIVSFPNSAPDLNVIDFSISSALIAVGGKNGNNE